MEECWPLLIISSYAYKSINKMTYAVNSIGMVKTKRRKR